jgi:hypothetical protein
MSKRKKILSGLFALIIGLSVALPMRASAADWNHHWDRNHHHFEGWRWDRGHDSDDYGHAWRWDRYQDHSRGYPYAYNRSYGYGYNPRNGQGMIDRRNPNLYWACDSGGHHCHWAPRY